MLDPNKIGFPRFVSHDEPYVDNRGWSVQRDFFDRDAAWTTIKPLMDAPDPTPVIIMGERRAGKTSLLKLIEGKLGRAPHNFVVVFTSYMDVTSMDSLLREILQNLELAIGTRLPDHGQAITDWSREFDLSTNSGMIGALQRILTSDFDGTLVICFDELDSALERVSPEDANRILGFVHGLVETVRLPVRVIVSMTRLPETMMRGASPLVTRAIQISLAPFTAKDLREMVDTLLADETTLTDEEHGRLYELSGGWPYYAKLILTYLDVQEDNRIDEAAQRAVTDAGVSDTLQHIFRYFWTDEERAVLLSLAYFGGYLSPQQFAALEASHRSAAQLLAQRHFVQMDQDHSCRFRIGFLACWFPQWHKFEFEMERRARVVVDRLIAQQAAGAHEDDDEYTIITDDDMRKYGLSGD